MTMVEGSVVVIGILIGYWVVSMMHASRKVEPAEELLRTERNVLIAPAGGQLDHHKVLGISADASSEEVRSAYRLQMSMYHPDKVASLGEELRSVAERKTKEINEAYAKALIALGENL